LLFLFIIYGPFAAASLSVCSPCVRNTVTSSCSRTGLGVRVCVTLLLLLLLLFITILFIIYYYLNICIINVKINITRGRIYGAEISAAVPLRPYDKGTLHIYIRERKEVKKLRVMRIILLG
jgi:hypothetical protein